MFINVFNILIIIIIIIIYFLRSRSSQTPNWCMRPPPPNNFTGKVYHDHEVLPWRNLCGLPHDQNTCMVSKEVFQQVGVINKDGPSDLNNYIVGEWPDMMYNVSNTPNEKAKGVKGKGLYLATIARDLAPKPSQEEIRRRI
jgi:hypothetical protein